MKVCSPELWTSSVFCSTTELSNWSSQVSSEVQIGSKSEDMLREMKREEKVSSRGARWRFLDGLDDRVWLLDSELGGFFGGTDGGTRRKRQSQLEFKDISQSQLRLAFAPFSLPFYQSTTWLTLRRSEVCPGAAAGETSRNPQRTDINDFQLVLYITDCSLFQLFQFPHAFRAASQSSVRASTASSSPLRPTTCRQTGASMNTSGSSRNWRHVSAEELWERRRIV